MNNDIYSIKIKKVNFVGNSSRQLVVILLCFYYESFASTAYF